MLQLKEIVKKYAAGNMEVDALKGVSIDFRKNEFVAVLGPSGCGKTTLLNIIGGLDRYTSGDLVINNISTKQYKDVDWDIYRNNSIGFVFQSYNLIPHQSALANVELAMTLAGISKSERRKRAVSVLEKVGLSDQINKKPNQMSGGQMQRVAIARALVNNPDILLADEPTGALDSETSLQIMEILKDIAKDRLVVMVTHNPEIASAYSNRIIRLLDGRITDDTNPFLVEEEQKNAEKKKKKKVSMSFLTALSLSLNNLMTKKKRTLLTAFAGSIGIIGIALIMSLSSGMQGYINNLEQDTLSTYPIQLESQTMDISGMMNTLMNHNNRGGINHDLDNIYSNNIMASMIQSMSSQIVNNDLKQFKQYIENGDGKRIAELTNSIQYGYDIDLQIYTSDIANGIIQVNPSTVFSDLGMNNANSMNMSSMSGMGMMGGDSFEELIDNNTLLQSQYNVLAGTWPSAYNEVVIVVDENNEISDRNLYTIGLLDASEINNMIKKVLKGEKIEDNPEIISFTYDEVLSLTFKLVLNTDYFTKEDNHWVDKRDDDDYMKNLVENAIDVKIVGIIKPNEEATATSIGSTIGYTSALTEYVIDAVNNSEIAREQISNPEINVFTGFVFDIQGYVESLSIKEVNALLAEMPEEERLQYSEMTAGMNDEEILALMSNMVKEQIAEAEYSDTYESNCTSLGVVDTENPSIISLYPKDFSSKEEITNIIKDYNKMQQDAGNDEYVINYTDIVGMMTSSISSIIDIISYVLIAFVAISLIVSSIMIAIITYISVLERTKEIGILRSIGASKGDISSVFNAETVIEGLVAGVLGIGITLLLNIPINAVIKSLADISGIAALPITGAVGLILLSILLTVLAGFIPSKIAAKKDPVVALRSE